MYKVFKRHFQKLNIALTYLKRVVNDLGKIIDNYIQIL
jgi:hypothetical protein